MMSLSIRFKIALVLTLLTISPGLLRVAHACSNLNPNPPLQEHIRNADVVVVATVIGVDLDISSVIDGGRYALNVERYLKGQGPAILHATGYGVGIGDCLNSAIRGVRAVYLLDGDTGDPYKMEASYAWVYSAVFPAETNQIQAIVQITGQSTAPDSMPPWAYLYALSVFPSEYLNYIIPFVGAYLIFRLFRRRKHGAEGTIQVFPKS